MPDLRVVERESHHYGGLPQHRSLKGQICGPCRRTRDEMGERSMLEGGLRAKESISDRGFFLGAFCTV